MKSSGKPAPYSHDLVKLAKVAGITMSAEQRSQMQVISTFNLSGRYTEYKEDFYRKANKAYTTEYFDITKELFTWLKKEYQEN